MGKPRHGPRTGPDSVRETAGRPLPPAGIWLLATVSGEELSVTEEFGTAPRGFGGDVFIHLAPGADGSVSVQVLAVAGGELVTAGTWESLSRRGWPERIRPSVVFAVSVLAVIREHADLGGVIPLAPGTRRSGLPDLPRRVTRHRPRPGWPGRELQLRCALAERDCLHPCRATPAPSRHSRTRASGSRAAFNDRLQHRRGVRGCPEG